MRWTIRRRVVAALLVLLSAAALWLLLTGNARVWPYRNAVRYYLFRGWSQVASGAPNAAKGVLAGMVQARHGTPISHARVLVSASNGVTWSAETGSTGRYQIADLPAGHY